MAHLKVELSQKEIFGILLKRVWLCKGATEAAVSSLLDMKEACFCHCIEYDCVGNEVVVETQVGPVIRDGFNSRLIGCG